MKRLVVISLVSLLCAANVATAEAPSTSLRPVARGNQDTVLAALVPASATEAQTVEPQAEPKRERKGLFSFLRPKPRTQKVEQQARSVKTARAKGMVCGDPDLQGDVIGAVQGAQSGCGVADAIQLRSVAGVALSQQSVMDCGTAQALKTWVNKGMKPAIGNRGGGVAKIQVAAHYICRGRNNQRGAKISEHGKGHAIDISGFTLRNGETITVVEGWGKRSDSKVLKAMHQKACGPFGTVLGPNANKFHRDHFHFDTARYRNGAYCK